MPYEPNQGPTSYPRPAAPGEGQGVPHTTQWQPSAASAYRTAAAQPAPTAVQPDSTAAQPSAVSAQIGSPPVQPNPSFTQSAPSPGQSTGAPSQPRAAGAQSNVSGVPSGYYPQAQQPKKSRWWIPVVVSLGLLLLMGALFSSCMASLSDLSSFGMENDFDENTVAVIDIDGTIQYDGTANSPEGLRSLLKAAEEDDNVKAIVLRVNSGGGVAAAGEEMSTYLADFEKPVVVSSAAINASAAYMISAQSDYIYVLNSTDIGSIGTIMQHYDLSELLAKLGVNIENIKSADSKDSSYYNRPLTDEERAEYQHQVDVINNNFIRMVAQGRNMTEDEVRALADGNTKIGKESVDAGLADAVGTFDDACEKAAELADLGDDYNVDTLSLYDGDFYNMLGMLDTTGNADTLEVLLRAFQEIENHDGSVH